MIRGNLPATTLLLLIATWSFDARADEFYGANIEAMGRASVANPSDTTSLSVNPGAIALDERYDFQGVFEIGPTGGLDWSLAALDARTAPIAFGTAWHRTIEKPPILLEEMPGWITPGQEVPNKKRTHEFTWALAVPALERKLSFGVGSTLLLRNDDRGGSSTYGNVDVGMGWRVSENWTLGLVGSDLVPVPKHPDLQTKVAAGVHYADEFLAEWALDVEAQITGDPEFPVSFRTGGELTISVMRPRLGYRFEGADATHWIIPGLGGESEAGGIDYAIAIPLIDGLKFNSLVHTISLRVKL